MKKLLIPFTVSLIITLLLTTNFVVSTPVVPSRGHADVDVPNQARERAPVFDPETSPVKRVIAHTTDVKDLEFLESKGCNVVHKIKPATSLNCPARVAVEFGLEDDLIVFAVDLNADKQIKADQVWNLGYTGSGRLIAVLDTGVDYTHAELSDSIVNGKDFVNDDNDSMDDNGHGTHVAGIITANGVNSQAKGVAPNANVLAVKVLSASGSGYFSDVVAAMYYVVDGPDGVFGTGDEFNADAISMSLGTGAPYLYTGSNCDFAYPAMTNAINYAVSKNVVVVAAAGNSGSQGVSLPGCISNAIAVGAVNSNDVRPSWSGAGNSLDIAAPGVNIYSTEISGYATYSGTSMATPHVSAVASLLRQVNSALSVSAIKNALYSTAKDLGSSGWDKYYGWGRVDALGAVQSILPPAPTHDVAVSSLVAPSSLIQGSVVQINVTATNTGNQPETFNLTLTDLTDSLVIGSVNLNLAGGTSQNVNFNWDTASATAGNHTLKAEASVVAGETNTVDNIKTAIVEVKVPDTQSPTAPTNLVATTISSSRIDLTWDASTDNVGVAGYKVFRDGVYVATVTNTGYSDTGLQPNTTYSYFVKAFDASNNESPPSNTATATTLPLPQQPKMHVASIVMSKETSGSRTRAVATVTVVDESNSPVSGVTVSGHWSGLTSDLDTKVTDSAGKVKIYSNWKRYAKGTFTFTVDNLVKSGWIYDSAANVETSDGITV